MYWEDLCMPLLHVYTLYSSPRYGVYVGLSCAVGLYIYAICIYIRHVYFIIFADLCPFYISTYRSMVLLYFLCSLPRPYMPCTYAYIDAIYGWEYMFGGNPTYMYAYGMNITKPYAATLGILPLLWYRQGYCRSSGTNRGTTTVVVQKGHCYWPVFSPVVTLIKKYDDHSYSEVFSLWEHGILILVRIPPPYSNTATDGSTNKYIATVVEQTEVLILWRYTQSHCYCSGKFRGTATDGSTNHLFCCLW
jgi:hypothetical protein